MKELTLNRLAKKRYLFVILIANLLMLSSGCSKDEIYINVGQEEGGNGGTTGGNGGTCPDSTTTQKKLLVDFTASIESVINTPLKSLTSMSLGKYVTVYAYKSGSTGTDGLNNFAIYKVEHIGSLTTTEDPMLLVPGNYDFYAVSTNTTTNMTPSFNNMETSVLENGVDYLWWTKQNVPIYNSDQIIPIVFEHCCTQLSLNLKSGTENIFINSFNKASITPPLTNTIWHIKTGLITPEEQLNTAMAPMVISNMQANQILLPMQMIDSLVTQININVNYETSPRNYQIKIPAPTSGFKAGMRYVYAIELLQDTVRFSSVQIKNWQEVNETGIPLYPERD